MLSRSARASGGGGGSAPQEQDWIDAVSPCSAEHGTWGTGTDEARAAQREIIEEFLRFGVSPAIEDGNGKSVLDCAKKSGWIREMFGGEAL